MSWVPMRGSTWWSPALTKTGKPHKTWGSTFHAEACALKRCDDCGLLKNAAHCKRWWIWPCIFGASRRNDPAYHREEPVLCMGCMNRQRPLARLEHTVRENRTLIGRIGRETARGKGREDRGTAPRVLG